MKWFFLLLAIPLWAQQPVRYEREADQQNEEPTIINLFERGLAVVWEDKKKSSFRNHLWNVEVLDKNLQLKKTHTFVLNTESVFSGYEYRGEAIYLLFDEPKKGKTSFRLIRWDFDTDFSSDYFITHELDFAMSHFWVVNQCAVLGGSFNKAPVVMLYHLSDQKLNVMPGVFEAKNDLLDVHPNENNTLNILWLEKKGGKQFLHIKITDTDANSLLEDKIEAPKGKLFLKACTSSLILPDMWVGGTWTDSHSAQSCGVFLWRVQPNQEKETVHFILYPQLPSFLTHLSLKKAAKIKTKAALHEEKNKAPVYFSYSTPYRLEENKSGLSLFLETWDRAAQAYASPYSYYPNSPYNNFYYPYSNPYLYNPPFSNMRTTEPKLISANVVRFDTIGEKDKDSSLIFPFVVTPYGDHTSDFVTTPLATVQAFEHDNTVYLQQTVGADVRYTTVDLSASSLNDDRAVNTTQSGLRKWYEQTFYAWGYYRKRGEGMRSNDYFFVQKISVDDLSFPSDAMPKKK